MKQRAVEVENLPVSVKAAIKRLVVSECSYYDAQYGCAPADSPCHMCGRAWNGTLCKYFMTLVLPLDKKLSVALRGYTGNG